MASDETIASGTLFAGRYEVVRCIARGGMGAIYEVVHVETARRRALKVILPDKLKSLDLQQRFRREARVAAQIESEFIVDVFDAGIDDATKMPFMVMELLKGENLEERLEKVGRFAPAEVVTYLHQLAVALEKTHAANIIHRDLKPENLFLTQRDDGQPRVKVLDFGVAKVLAEGAVESETTRSLGTPLYMSPEQYTAASKVAPATDIYALGMIAYTLLTGGAYYVEEAERDGNIALFSVSIRTGPQERASARAARAGVSLPPAFDAWFSRIASVDPKQRFQSAMTAVTELASALGVPLPGAQPAPAAPKVEPVVVVGPGSTAPMSPQVGTVPLPRPQGAPPAGSPIRQTLPIQGATPSPAYSASRGAGGAPIPAARQSPAQTLALDEAYPELSQPSAQSPLAQTPLAQAPLAQTPLAQAPLAQAPFAQAPFAQTPLPARGPQPSYPAYPAAQMAPAPAMQAVHGKKGSSAAVWIIAVLALVLAGAVTGFLLLRASPGTTTPGPSAAAPEPAPSASAPSEAAASASAPSASASIAPSAEPAEAPPPAPSTTARPRPVRPGPRRR